MTSIERSREGRRGASAQPVPASPADGPLKASEFRLFLQSELVRRCQANRRYSLRAFARALSLEPSALSKILAGKRKITLEMFHRVTRQLALGPEEVGRFLGFNGGGQAVGGEVPAGHYDQINLDSFQVISDWYHFAICELAHMDHFRGEPYWVARTLGISVSEARVALERLLRLGMLTTTENGKVIGTGKTVTTVGSAYTAAALRKMQRQILEKAIAALDEIPAERRDQSCMTMAVNVDRLDSAKEMIRDFRRRLCAHLEKDPPRTEVYHLTISLYPVTNVGR